MDLQEFVTATLIQIRSGVIAANQAFNNTEVFSLQVYTGVGVNREAVEFDVAVTVSVSGSAEAHGKAGIRVVEGGVASKVEGQREHVSRVRFKIMVNR